METNGKKYLLPSRFSLFWALLFSVSLHVVILLGVEPTFYRAKSPIITSWLDLLSQKDIDPVSFKKNRLTRELIPSQISKDFFSDSHQSLISHGQIPRREIFPPHTASHYVPSDKIILSKKFMPLAAIIDTESRQLTYRVVISPQGRVLSVTPLILPIHDSTENYVQEYLKSSFLRLGEDDFIWTKVHLVIE